MDSSQLTITYIGGPTALLDFNGVRLVTDPTFDPAGGQYPSGAAVLRKLMGPAIGADQIGRVDGVLLSHHHHHDNLDHAGHAFLSQAKTVFTTPEGAQQLGGNSVGLKMWESRDVNTPSGKRLRMVATPARHGPANMDRGPVCGFVFFFTDAPERAAYFSGDTVWYEGVAEVAKRYPIRAALLNLGAARVAEVGPFHLTMTSKEGVEAASAFPDAAIIPLHFEGWAHFSEGRDKIAEAFTAAKMLNRLTWPQAGRAVTVSLS